MSMETEHTVCSGARVVSAASHKINRSRFTSDFADSDMAANAMSGSLVLTTNEQDQFRNVAQSAELSSTIPTFSRPLFK